MQNKQNHVFLHYFFIISTGFAINFLAYTLNQRVLKTPLYMDSIGTVLVSATLGILPGMIVGYFSILISSVIESSQQYYSVIAVFIALLVGYPATKGVFRKLSKVIAILPPVVIVDTILGVFLNSLGFFDSSPVYLTSYAKNSRIQQLFSEIISTIIIEAADKLLALLLVYFAMRFCYLKLKKNVYSYVERDIFASEYSIENSSTTIKHSLRHAVAFTLAGAGFLIIITSLLFEYHFNCEERLKEYHEQAKTLSNEAALLVSDELLPIVLQMKENTDYVNVKSKMAQNLRRFPEIRAVCIFVEEKDGRKKAAMYCGRDESEYVKAGDYLPDDINPNIRQFETPIFDNTGMKAASAMAYYSLLDVRKNSLDYCARIFSVMLGVLLCIVAVIIIVADRNLVVHINRMTDAMSRFAYDTDEGRLNSVEKIKSLNIRGGNELEALYNSICKTVSDYINYIEEANRKSEEINRIQTNVITTIADLIESRDSETGQHTRRTSAYVNTIARQLRSDGKFTDLLTEEYIENMTIAASLHDIGKICISDTILNKPGRLTNEEFEKMKEHTTAGRKILMDITQNLGETAYLQIAKDLAGYHHEWWNGNGYPDHLKEDEIPLSARIMAIADVFDALISIRPYKKAFTIEEAIGIIHKEKGTHFQAEIVDAFDKAMDEIKSISNQYLDEALANIGKEA